MLSVLALAALLFTAPAQPSPKPPKPTPEQRLARVDNARMALNLGGRVYGRFLTAPPAYGGAVQLGVGVRLVRGLYVAGEASVGAHGLPYAAGGQLFLGLRHELRMSKWVRPSFSLGYSHLIDVSWETTVDPSCGRTHEDDEFDFDFSGSTDVELAQRHGVEAGLGLRFPFRWAPRLSAYLRADVDVYVDALPGHVQVAGGGGVQVVF
jgi:hypothetical protein